MIRYVSKNSIITSGYLLEKYTENQDRNIINK